MKRLFFLLIFSLVLPGACFALTTDDTGYAWKAASYEEKTLVCKELASTLGKDYIYWLDILNAFYDNTNWNIQSLKINEVATQIPLSEQLSGQ